jgi:hypothetical protein
MFHPHLDGLTLAEQAARRDPLALEAVVRYGTAGSGSRSLQSPCSMPFPLSAAITKQRPSPEQPVNREGWWTRDHALVVVLVAATVLLLVLCWQLVRPFMAPLAWALALAVVAHPVHRWIARRIKKPGLAAGFAVFVIGLVLAALVIFVGHSVVTELAAGAQTIQSGFESGRWREQVAQNRWLGPAFAVLEKQANLAG